MKDNLNQIIYIGKAKNLKNRVSQYFLKNQSHSKVKAMVEKVADFDYLLTPSEIDALALESNLIKKHQPFYNILLKDGKAFPYIKIDVKSDFPKVEIVRRIKNDGSKYFGPYISGISIHEVVDIINYVFPIRKCKLNIGKANVKRECLNYSLNLCSAPCTNKIIKEDYKKIVDEVIDFLNGNDNLVESRLEERMKNQIEAENFEGAIETREKLKMVQRLKEKSVASLPKDISLDAFAQVTTSYGDAICVLTLRNGKILGVNSFYAPEGADNEDALSSFIVQYYSGNITPPKEIITSQKIENAEDICKLLNKNINIHHAIKGIKSKIIEMAKANATEFLQKKSNLEERKRHNIFTALENLKNVLNLSKIPNRMECYDISHLFGEESVASMVVFENGVPSKKEYRKFKIKTVAGIDDFASMYEVIDRRIKRLKENDTSFIKSPDLIVIDGGKGQLSSAVKALEDNNFKCDIISLAKKFEEVYTPGSNSPVMLKRASPELTMLQRLRDEAHRFAITFHRTRRDKKALSSTNKASN
ncbi:MAG: excinuclease ABC subunit UvrC [Firmicutes bacterium]|nr:excinuclease ABC subunit UvrC [Bacillota bacterium]